MSEQEPEAETEVEELADAVGVDTEVIVEKIEATTRVAESSDE
jgi:hypothetical protein